MTLGINQVPLAHRQSNPFSLEASAIAPAITTDKKRLKKKTKYEPLAAATAPSFPFSLAMNNNKKKKHVEASLGKVSAGAPSVCCRWRGRGWRGQGKSVAALMNIHQSNGAIWTNDNKRPLQAAAEWRQFAAEIVNQMLLKRFSSRGR